jgi:hypothetical protein
LVISLFSLSRLLLEIGFLAATPQASRAARRFCVRLDFHDCVLSVIGWSGSYGNAPARGDARGQSLARRTDHGVTMLNQNGNVSSIPTNSLNASRRPSTFNSPDVIACSIVISF